MKKTGVCLAGLLATVSMFVTSAFAAELLDVKPVMTAAGVTVEVTADIPMTYTYYKVSGQAQTVVDIADADPEKIEPLLVVNQGALSSISVDTTVISSMTVSRLIFNLAAEAEIQVTPAPDRKKIVVAFIGTHDQPVGKKVH